MFHIKDDVLADLETNPWLRFKYKLLRFITSPYRMIKSLFLITGALVWTGILVLAIAVFSLLENLPHFQATQASTGFEQAKQAALARVSERYSPERNQERTPDHTEDSPVAYQWTAIDDVNRELLYAIVMSEDGDFFTHKGIDYDALINALGENIKRRKWSFGASTISQQTVKNIYFSEAKTLYRKLKELITVRRLEQALNKNQILELYLNVIEFGPDIYGVAAASKYYFDKTPAELNAAEGAFLAILMPSPRKYHFTIFQNKHMAPRHMRKYKRILQDMRFKEYISPVQYKTYLNWPFFK